MSSHNRHRPVLVLPIERVADGEITIAEVRLHCEDPEERLDIEYQDGKSYIDISGSCYHINITLAGRQYVGSPNEESGSHALREVQCSLEADGYRLRCCCSCQYYYQSGMIKDFSFDTKGYCILNEKPKIENVTFMLHTCPDWLPRLVKPIEIMRARGWIGATKKSKLLTGTAASPGIAVGFVRNIGEQDPQGMAKTMPGEVIVAAGYRIDSLSYPLGDPMDFLKMASAFVTDGGGRTCSAAIVARELGIPAVTGTVDGTVVLRTGQKVIVDGTEGAVYSCD